MKGIKKHWKISIVIVLAILCVTGVVLGITFSGNEPAAETVTEKYTVSVKGPTGSAVEEVYVMLCNEDGTEVTWLPYVTNESGKVQYSQNLTEGCYVKVVAVPEGYALDESVKWSFDENGEVIIVLDADDGAYVAKIGEKSYSSFTSAIATANASSEDVTIELLADVTLKTGSINNNYDKNITIKGNGYTLTTSGGNNAFALDQETGVISFENMTIVHKNYGAIFQVNSLVTLNLTNVVLDATTGNEYRYALINTLATDGTTTLNLDGVEAKMAVSSAGASDHSAVIRTGNTSGTKTVNMNLKNCNFDTTAATGRCGIIVMKNTVANINVENSTLTAGDAYAIWAVEQSKAQTMTATGTKFAATEPQYANEPIKGYAAQMGNTYYLTLAHAAEIANEAKEDTVISLVADVTMKTCAINNVNGKTVLIDGKGKTVTTSGGSNAFVVGNKVAFKDLTINHKNTGSAIHVTEVAQIEANNVNINATEGEAYNYTLVNILAAGEGTTLDFTKVNVRMAVETEGKDSYASIIRTGNTTEEKSVVINLTDCNFDTTEAAGRCGIAVVKNTKAVIDLKNTTIATKDAFVIRSNEQEILLDNVKLTSLDEKYQTYPIEGYLAKIKDTFYTFKQALTVANEAKEDTNITLLADYTIKSYTINNTNGKNIVIDGNGKKITTNGGNNAFVVGNNVAFKNMTINHKNTGSVVQVTEAGNVALTDVMITATEGDAYNYALINVAATDDVTTLKLNGVDAVMSVAGRGKGNDTAILRTGNNDEAKTVNINLTDCNFDTTCATGRSGIVVMKKTTANMNLTNTTIKTLDAAAIKSNETGLSQSVHVTNCTFDSITKEFNAENEPIHGYEAMLSNVVEVKQTKASTEAEAPEAAIAEATVYLKLADAVTEANTFNEDVLIQLLSDFTRGVTYNIDNVHGKSVTIDGRNHTLTTKNGNNLFRVYEAESFELKNMTIKHSNKGAVVQVWSEPVSDVEVNLTNVIIDATEPGEEGYEYALINIMRSSTLNLTGVKAAMAVETEGLGGYNAIIRTGNAGQTKDVEINLVDCKLDATGAVKRNGLLIMEGTNAVVTMEGTRISTMDASAIRSEETSAGSVTVSSDCKVVSGKKDEYENYSIKIGDTWYVNYEAALSDAVANATEDTTITLTSDMELNLDDLANNNGCTITLDANGNCITTTGTKDDSIVILSDASMAEGDTTFYLGLEAAVEKANNAASDVTIYFEKAASVALTDICNAYGNTITLDTNGNCIQVTGELRTNVEIVSEAAYEDEADTYYLTFMEAMTMARESTTDVTVTLLADVEITSCTIKNADSKNIILNGNGKKLTGKGGNNTLVIDQKGTVEIKNLTIEHQNHGAAIQMNQAATVNVTDVVIDATKPGENGYKYALISITAQSETETAVLNLTRVDVDMDVTTTGSDGAIIRTGNNDQTKTIQMTLIDCNLDARGASGRAGIRIMQNTTAAIDLIDTDIKVLDECPIWDNSTVGATINKTGYTVSSETHVAQVGTALYEDLTTAITEANALNKDVVIELLGEAAVGANVSINNTNGKTVTFEGNGKTITTSGGKNNNALLVAQTAEAAFKNLTIVHKNYGSAIQVTAAGTVSLTDVTIDAANPENNESNYRYALINLAATSGTTTLNLTNVDITMASEIAGKDVNGGIIRTGNAGDVKTVNINITDSTLDTTGATRRSGIVIQENTTATVNITDSEIRTLNDFPILDNSGKANVNKIRTKAAITDDAYSSYVALIGTTYPINADTSKADEALFDDLLYTSLTDALTYAKTSTEDVTIELISDITIGANNDIINANAKAVTMDGNMYTITATGGNNTFRIGKPQSGDVTFKNMTIDHRNYGAAIQVRDNITADTITVTLTDVDITATNPYSAEKGYQYAIINLLHKNTTTLNLTRVNVDMDVTTESLVTGRSGIILTGNNVDASTKVITMNLIECDLDATGAVGRSGILILDAEATISLKDTKIQTQNEEYCSAIQGSYEMTTYPTQTKKAAITIEGNCLLKSGDSQEQSVTIKGLDENSTVTGYPGSLSLNSIALDEEETEETITITLQVPKSLYETFIEWLKDFAEKFGWDLEL